MNRSKYQIFPTLPSARQETLKASIMHHGVENPTSWDHQGNLLDGWERENISEQFGIGCPREVRVFDSEAERFRFILAVNAHRRPALSQEQKREVIAAYLRGDPGVADNMLGDTLGVSKNTVLTVRRRLESNGDIRKVTETIGKDGKCRPVRYAKRIITNTPDEFDEAKEIIKGLPANCAGKTVDITTAKRFTIGDKAYAHRKELKGSDYYPTPPSLVWELLKTNEMQGRRDFYEPACGKDKAIANELIKAGLQVRATDIEYGDDFLSSREWHETIITNPPFSLFDEFVRKARTSCSLFAFIAKTNFFGAYQRHQDGVWQHLKKVYIFNRQVDYRSPIREDGCFQVGNLITGWFIWDMTWQERYWHTEIMDVQPYAQGHNGH